MTSLFRECAPVLTDIGQHLLVYLREFLHLALPREFRSDVLSGRFSESPAQIGVRREFTHRFAEIFDGLIWVDRGNLPTDSRIYMNGRPTDIEADHRKAGGHCLNYHHATRFM